MLAIFVIYILTLQFVKTQLPPGYTCVPAGTCPPTSGGSGLDPRIVSGGNPCPPGQVPCLVPTPAPNTCGRRAVTNVSPFDGFATQGAWPWAAYIMNQTGFCGGGVLVNANTVLTAAHKVVGNRNTPSAVGVYMGVYTPSQLSTRLSVGRITIHPNFSIVTFFNNIAVLTLTTNVSPLPQQLVNTVCLPTATTSFVNQLCSVSGWGQTGFTVDDAPLVQQKQVNVTIVNYTTCYTSMSNPTILGPNVNAYLDPVGEICAGGEASRDACTYDGGSPLVCFTNNAYVLAGLVIWGKGCGRPGTYGVYVSIPNYMTWIQSVINANP